MAFRSPRWLRRLGSSCLIGGQALAAAARGKVPIGELSDNLMEAGPSSFLVVLIIGLFTSVFTGVTMTRMWVAGWLKAKRPREINI